MLCHIGDCQNRRVWLSGALVGNSFCLLNSFGFNRMQWMVKSSAGGGLSKSCSRQVAGFKILVPLLLGFANSNDSMMDVDGGCV